jgi:hypothetical protein
MSNAQLGMDRSCKRDEGVGQRLRAALQNLEQSVQGTFESAETTASCEDFRRAIGAVNENIWRVSQAAQFIMQKTEPLFGPAKAAVRADNGQTRVSAPVA